MSRAAVSKSRAEKGKGPLSAPTPAITHEIVAGKYNDQDWSHMMDRDDGEEYVADIMEEMLRNTMAEIYDLYIQGQLLPYTITQAKDAILQIIEWQFLARDEGEKNPENDPSWMQDEEPDPAMTDCWAQGSVPRTYIPPTTPFIILEVEEDEVIVPQSEVSIEATEEVLDDQSQPEMEDTVSETAKSDTEEAAESETRVPEPPSKKQSKPKRKRFQPHYGPLKSAGTSRMTDSLEQTEMNLLASEMGPPQMKQMSTDFMKMPASCHSILKVQSGRPPGNKDVLYDEMGNVLAVVKLDPNKLPSYRVKVGYQIVDPEVEAAQARLEAMRTGRYMPPPQVKLKQKSARHKVDDEINVIHIPSSASKISSKESVTPLPPPLTEAMEVSAGVTVKEGGRIKKGTSRYVRNQDLLEESLNGLRPVTIRTMLPTNQVSDFLERTTPILRPIRDSPALPPIVPHSLSQPQISS